MESPLMVNVVLLWHNDLHGHRPRELVRYIDHPRNRQRRSHHCRPLDRRERWPSQGYDSRCCLDGRVSVHICVRWPLHARPCQPPKHPSSRQHHDRLYLPLHRRIRYYMGTASMGKSRHSRSLLSIRTNILPRPLSASSTRPATARSAWL
jgi:hypothetical protein